MRIKYIIPALLLLTTPAYAQTGTVKTITQLNTEINTQFPDNLTGAITPFIFRQLQLDLTASAVLLQSLASVLASPPAIGGIAPNTGAFTTLSASSTVSGAGFSAYLASPPPIGGTAPNTGAFSTLTALSANSTYSSLQSGTPTLGTFAAGQVANPITSANPTIGVSRYEAITTATQGGQNAAVTISSEGNNTSSGGVIAQTNSLAVFAKQIGKGDVVAGYFSSQQSGTPLTTSKSYHSFGVFSVAVADSNVNNQAIAVNSVAFNSTGSDCDISNANQVGGYGCGTYGELIQGGGSKLNTAAIYVLAASPSWFDVGLYIATGSVKTYSIDVPGVQVTPDGQVNFISSQTASPIIHIRNSHATASDYAMYVGAGAVTSDTTAYEMVFYDGTGTNVQGAIQRAGTAGINFHPTASDAGADCPSGVNATTVVVIGGIVTHC